MYSTHRVSQSVRLSVKFAFFARSASQRSLGFRMNLSMAVKRPPCLPSYSSVSIRYASSPLCLPARCTTPMDFPSA
eukprot:8987298-Heterocapsa_arctica.AAC.1